ncbi:MAG: hypothetical protein QM697_12015 [Lachnospiraceae bacterium]
MKKFILLVFSLLFSLSLISCNRAGSDQNISHVLNTEDEGENVMTINTMEHASAYLLDKLAESGYDTDGTAVIPEPFIADDNWFAEKNNVWYFAWGKSIEEKLMAEKYFAVTDDWEFWEYDGLHHKWLNLACDN